MRHRSNPLAAAVRLAAALSLAAAPAAAQETLADPAIAGVRLELAALNETLQRIESLLQRQIEGQRLELVLQRIDITSGRIGQLEREIEDLRGMSTGIEQERLHYLHQLEQAEAALAATEPGADDQQMRNFVTETETHLARLAERQRDIDARLPLLENRLTSMRRDLEDWQGYFDREVVEE